MDQWAVAIADQQLEVERGDDARGPPVSTKGAMKDGLAVVASVRLTVGLRRCAERRTAPGVPDRNLM